MALLVAELIADIRDDLDEPVAAVWQDEQILGWLNAAVTRVVAALRATREDFMVSRMVSTDAALTIHGVSYDPASLQIVSGTEIYTLPPDLVEIRSIEPASDDDLDDGITFQARDMSHPDFRLHDRITTTSSTDTTFFYDIFDTTSLKIVPMPARTIDLEIFYVRYHQHHTFDDTISILPDFTRQALRAYAVYRAYKSIAHPDTSSALGLFNEETRTVQSLSRPRQSQTINVVPEDDGYDGSYGRGSFDQFEE